MYIKKNARVTFRSNRRPNFKRNNGFSNNKSRNKGNVTQQYNKYLKLAKEASSSGDRIQTEYYYQFTDHYYRIMLELGINLEDNEMSENPSTELLENSSQENITSTPSSNIEKKDDVRSDNKEASEDNNGDIESIESIPFIAKPPKKKITKTKKASA